MTTLISFLGKSQASSTSGYRNARYRFDAGFVREVPYFGLALTDYLHPDRLILLGTAGSMWDVFFVESDTDSDSLAPLIDAAHSGEVTEEMLHLPSRRLSDKLGVPVECHLIPFARDQAERTPLTSAKCSVKPAGISLAVAESEAHASSKATKLAVPTKTLRLDDIR